MSEDIDFDLDADMVQVTQYANDMAARLTGYDITEFRKVYHTIQFYCSYASPLGGKDHVRIDIASKKILTSRPLLKKRLFLPSPSPR